MRLPREHAGCRNGPGYSEGAWWVQDAAAALPARVLMQAVGPSGRVCELCAAPGGKTAQLAAAGYDVTAVDISADRVGMMNENLKRLGLTVRDLRCRRAPPGGQESRSTRVLLDAPCSATDTHPPSPGPAATSSAPKTSQASPRLQTKLLAAAVSPWSSRAAFIVYSVCSLQPEERKAVVDVDAGSPTRQR